MKLDLEQEHFIELCRLVVEQEDRENASFRQANEAASKLKCMIDRPEWTRNIVMGRDDEKYYIVIRIFRNNDEIISKIPSEVDGIPVVVRML